MTEDRLLNDLGDLARREEEAERAGLDERWDRLAAGTLTAEEEAELRALAASSPAAREAYEAFRPLGADFQARVVGAIKTEQPEPRKPAHTESRSRFRSFRRDPGRLEVWLGAAAAVAAVLVFLVRGLTALPPLPVYTADLEGGTQAFRGEPASSSDPQVFVPDSLLTLEVRPQQPVEGPVEVRGFLAPAAGAGEIVPWQPETGFEVAGGSVRLRGTVGREIQLPPGTWRLWIVVGRPGEVPGESEIVDALLSGRTRQEDWQAISADLRVADRASPETP
jgi:hypothetical protein